MTILLLLSGSLCIGYSILLNLLNPPPLADFLFSFTNIWAIIGSVLIFLGVWRLCHHGKSFFTTCRRWFRITFRTLFFTGVAIAFCNLLLILFPQITGGNLSSPESIPYLILLGGGVNKEGELVQPVQKRITAAAEYLTANPDCVCVVTGGTLKHLTYAETPALRNALTACGITPERILEEDQALDTIQNFRYSALLLSEYTGNDMETILREPVVVVTNRFHIARSLYLAKRLGFTKVTGYAAPSTGIYVLHNYLYEISAWVKLELRILLTGQPKHVLQLQ